MSFLELAAVVAIVSLLTITAISTFGNATLSNGGAEGFARKLALALNHARRATIATGDNHYLQLSPSSSAATSFALYRRTGSGSVQVDASHAVPRGVTLSASHDVLEFDFDGAAMAGYSLDIAGENRSWNITVITLTGMTALAETTP